MGRLGVVMEDPAYARRVHFIEEPLLAVVRNESVVGTVFDQDHGVGVVVVGAGLERRPIDSVAGRVGVLAGLQETVEGHHAADVEATADALDDGHAAEAVADRTRGKRSVDGGMVQTAVQPFAEQCAEQFVVVVHGDETLEALLLEGWDAARIVRPDALARRHDVAVDIDGETDVAHPRQVLGDIDVKELEPLVVVDDQDQGSRAIVGRRCHEVSQVVVAAEAEGDVVAAQVGRRWPEVGRGHGSISVEGQGNDDAMPRVTRSIVRDTHPCPLRWLIIRRVSCLRQCMRFRS